MPLVEITALRNLLKHNQRLIGIDLGERTLGLALSDVRLKIATPMQTLMRGKFSHDAAALLEIAKAQDVGGFVLGLPINMDGSEGKRGQSTRSFARALINYCDYPLCFWDERLSTQAVTRTLLDADASRAKRDAVIDKMAASYILQGALERMEFNASP